MSDILSDEEDLARLKSWWGEYGTTILVSVGLALVVIIGWRWWESQQAASIAAASDAYQTYSTAAPAEKASALEVLASEHAGTAYYAFALLDQAKQSIDAGDLATARTHLSAAVDAAPHALLGDLARLRLARVLRGLGEEDAAMNMLTAIKSEGYLAWALEAKGDMHAAVGEVEQAHAAYTAAKEALQGDLDRPILQLKLDNTAPFNNEFVEFESGLDSALSEAEETLQSLLQESEAQGSTQSDAQSDTQSATEEAVDESGDK